MTGLWRLAFYDVWAMRARAAISTIGIAVGVLVLVVVVGLGLGVRTLVLKEVVREMPLDIIEVIPKSVDLGLFRLGTGALFGSAPLDDATLQKLSSMPYVAAAYPKLEVKVPMGARGGAALFGKRLYTDLFMTGVPKELVVPEAGAEFADRSDVVPVVISDQLVEIYNSSVASTLGTPQLSPQALAGFEFEISFGRSMMLGDKGATREGLERARIVGTSRYAMRLGVTVPLEVAKRISQTYGEPSATPTYRSILLRVDEAAHVPAVSEAVQGLGLAVDESARRTGNLLAAGTALASLVGLLVLLLAALNIAHSFFASLSERQRELAILRAVGATPGILIGLVLRQASLIGLAGGVLGVSLAAAATFTIDLLAQKLIPDFPFKPESFFVLPVSLLGGAVAVAVLMAVLGAWLPAVWAARRSLARALAEG